MQKHHLLRSSVSRVFSAFAIIILASFTGLGLLSCSNVLPDTSFPVSVSLNGGGAADSKGVSFSDGLVTSVAILVYDSSGERIGSGNLTKRTSDWGGTINVTSTGTAVFEANALDSSGSIRYVGRVTKGLTGSGDIVTIAVGAAALKGGSIQGQPVALSTRMVNTFAGTAGTAGTGSGGPLTGIAALLMGPYGMATDGTNLYISNYLSNNIRKVVIATQVVTTFAGQVDGAGSWTEADGVGAAFHGPTGITTDGLSLYVTDTLNNCIRKIDIANPQAVITFAGSRSQTAGATEGIGTGEAALFSGPRGITNYNGFLYIADTVNNKIRKLNIASRDVTTLAGASNIIGSPGAIDGVAAVASFYGPQGITNDGTNLYIADTTNNKIRQVRISDGLTSTIAGTGVVGSADGNGNVATFNQPVGITTDGTYIYVTDSLNSNIRRIQIAGTLHPVTTLAGLAGTTGTANGAGNAARFYNPYGITTDGTNLYVSDYTSHTIRKIQ